MWQFRPEKQRLDLKALYAGMPWLFTIKLYHGGEFTKFRERKYIDGKVSYVDMVDIDEFSIHDLDTMMKGLGYSVPPVIYYHFQIPNADMHFDLCALGNDDDLLNLAEYVKDNNMICIYTKHGITTLLTYFMAPKGPRKVLIEEINEVEERNDASPVVEGRVIEAIDKSKNNIIVSSEYTRRRVWVERDTPSSCSRRLNMNDIPPATSPVVQGADVVQDKTTMMPDHEDHVEITMDDKNMHDEEAKVDEGELNDQEDEVQMPNDEGSDEFIETEDDEDSEDNDFWVDKENLIEDVDVDMRDFHIHVDKDAEFMGRSNVEPVDGGEDDNELDVIDNDEHRFWIKHIYENMRKSWQTREYQDHLWKCATATTVPEFEHYMKEFSSYDKQAYDWLKQIPPQHWERSHFTGRALSDMLLNNLCKVFNSKLIDGRDKPIISCLEYIREYLMKRIYSVVKVIDKSWGPLTPTATKLLDKNIDSSARYTCRWNGSFKYQVEGPWLGQHVVDMQQRACTCRKWEPTGIPCKHVIATLNDMVDKGEEVGQMFTYVDKVYWLETWKATYSFKIDPIKGRVMWPTSNCPLAITPPPHHKLPGRPKKKRRLSKEERTGSQTQKTSQMSRKFMGITCRGQGGEGGSQREV